MATVLAGATQLRAFAPADAVIDLVRDDLVDQVRQLRANRESAERLTRLPAPPRS